MSNMTKNILKYFQQFLETNPIIKSLKTDKFDLNNRVKSEILKYHDMLYEKAWESRITNNRPQTREID